MNSRKLSIAFFTTQDRDPVVTFLIESLRKDGNEVHLLADFAALRYAEDVELVTFHAIVLDAQHSTSGQRYLLLTGELRAQPDLADMPLVILADSLSQGVRKDLYADGADVIYPANVPPKDLQLMLRKLLSKQEERRLLLEDSKFADERENDLIQSLNGSPTPIVVLHAGGSIRWMSSEALKAFGIRDLFDPGIAEYLQHLGETLHGLCIAPEASNKKTHSIVLQSTSGNQEWWKVNAQPFFNPQSAKGDAPSQSPRGFVLFLRTRAREHLIDQRAQHIAQLEAMSLHTGACAHSILQKTTAGIVVGPYLRIAEHLDSAEPKANVNAVVTSLLEYLDPVINPEVAISVRANSNQIINLTFGDAFQLLGHMLFNAIGFVLSRGEITIECHAHEPGVGTTVLLTAQSTTRARLIPVLDKETLREEHVVANPEIESVGGQLSSRFTRIREITARYRTELLFQAKGDDTLKLRVNLPSNPPAE